jgi:RimJ/RimL family protein N-acetyltransferase
MPTIEGEGLVLRDISRDDIPVIHRWLSDPETVGLTTWRSPPQTTRETERFVEAQTSGDDPLNRAFVILLRENRARIGIVGCFNIDWRNRSGELGIVIGEKKYRARGHGPEAMKLILAFGFEELNLHRLDLRVFDFNDRAIKSYRKCGLVEECRLREVLFRDGEYHDIVIMSILEDEYYNQKTQRKVAKAPRRQGRRKTGEEAGNLAVD